MNLSLRLRLLPLLLAGFGAVAYAQEPDKDEIATDRPDFVESSKVVGAGRFQLETSVAFERDASGTEQTRTWSTPTLLRFGVSDTLELRLETDGRIVARAKDLTTAARHTDTGYADLSIGAKVHLADQAGQSPALAVLVHADLPSGSSSLRGQHVRPSARVAAEWDLPDEWSVGVMPGIIYDSRDDGRRFGAGIFALTLGKDWGERWHGFAELAAPRIARAANGGSIATFDIGTAYVVTKDCQLDVALFKGLNKNSPELAVTAGVSIRF